MTDRETAVRLALLKVLSEMLGETKTAAAGVVKKDWRPGDRLTAVLPGGVSVGTVSMSNGATTSKVADEISFTEWVRKTHPEQVETVKFDRVKPAFQERLLSAARKLGTAVDAETGEEVPGITISAGDPYPSVKLAEDARTAVAEAWLAGELTELVSGLLAIEGGE
jgi:hypothetical protein